MKIKLKDKLFFEIKYAGVVSWKNKTLIWHLFTVGISKTAKTIIFVGIGFSIIKEVSEKIEDKKKIPEKINDGDYFIFHGNLCNVIYTKDMKQTFTSKIIGSADKYILTENGKVIKKEIKKNE